MLEYDSANLPRLSRAWKKCSPCVGVPGNSIFSAILRFLSSQRNDPSRPGVTFRDLYLIIPFTVSDVNVRNEMRGVTGA